MEYNGWTLYDKVVITECVARKHNNITEAYVSDASNKRQIESARRMAGGYSSNPVKPVENVIDNGGFKMEILDSPDSISHSKNQATVSCIVSHEDKRWIISIDLDTLVLALRDSTCINGAIQQQVFFARRNGAVGLLPYGGKLYKEAAKDMQTKKQLNSSKTSKTYFGREYLTLQRQEVLLGTVYCWYDEMSLTVPCKPSRNYYYNTINQSYTRYVIKKTPRINYLFLSQYETNELKKAGCISITDVLNKKVKDVEEKMQIDHNFSSYDLLTLKSSQARRKRMPHKSLGEQVFVDDFSPENMQLFLTNSFRAYSTLYSPYTLNKQHGNFTGIFEQTFLLSGVDTNRPWEMLGIDRETLIEIVKHDSDVYQICFEDEPDNIIKSGGFMNLKIIDR